MKKRLLATLLAGVMVLSLAACSGGNNEGNGLNIEMAELEPLTKDDVVQICVRSHPSWPYREDWKIWEYIDEGFGGTLDVIAIPQSEYSTKLTLMFTDAKTVPDIADFSSKSEVDKYARQGALIPYEDIAQYMPNLTKFYNNLPEDSYEQRVSLKRSVDGKLYFFPNHGREKTQNVRAWLYRKDIFDKHNLAVPTTFDEVYEVCKELKAIYPDSYPFCVRSGGTALAVTGPSWKPYFTMGVYYDYTDDTWHWGAIEDVALDILTYYKRMIDEGLLMPNFWNISASSWQELITTDRGFIMPEYQTRIDFFNPMAREHNPDFNLVAMVPPVANAETGLPMVNKYNIDPYGLAICNSKVEKRVINAARYLDWLYDDEVVQLVSWGKEGETYEVVDGKKQFILDDSGTQVLSLYGISMNGSCSRIDAESLLVAESADIAATRDMVLEHTVPYGNPSGDIAFTHEESTKMAVILENFDSYQKEMIAKFILGQEPLSKFDEFVAEMKNRGVEEFLSYYEMGYNRMLER